MTVKPAHRAIATVAALLALSSCDPVKVETSKKTAPSTIAPPPQPFVIEPKVWGEAGEGVGYEVRSLPDGSPGLFTSDGALLVELLPELIIDAGPAGQPRRKPVTSSFELVQLESGKEFGFTLYGRFKDDDANTYDLRIQNGKGDPRVHVAIGTRWLRDVEVHRLVAVFRTGLINRVEAMGTDYDWKRVGDEWISSVHAPHVMRFGEKESAFTVVGREGTDGLSAHKDEKGRWDIELELYHYDNHPLAVGDRCDRKEIDGVARFDHPEDLELRADIVLGPSEFPVASRYPENRRAAIALVDGADPTPTVAMAEDDAITAVPRASVSLADPSKLACEGLSGRLGSVAASGVKALAAGTELFADVPNLLQQDEADARRAIVFDHPDAPLTIFRPAKVATDEAAKWYDERGLANLRDDFGLSVVHTDVAALLKADASATGTVGDLLGRVASDGSVWVAPVDEIAAHLLAAQTVDLDFLPDGVVRVRNSSDRALSSLALRLPANVQARFTPGEQFESNDSAVWFDVPANGQRLLQLYRGEEPFHALVPADVKVVRDRPDEPATP